MEPNDPLSQLVTCCFGRRPRSTAGGFRTVALRNQYYYSPSMAHMNGAMGTWPLVGQAGPGGPMFATTAGLQPTQPYILLTQPVIMANPGLPAQVASVQQQQQQLKLAAGGGQLQAIPYIATSTSPMHKVPSILPGQHAIYAFSSGGTNGAELARRQRLMDVQAAQSDAIYDSPRQANIVRNMSTYMAPQQVISERQQQLHSRQIAFPSHTLQPQSQQQQQLHRQRRLNSDIFRRLELLERQVDLTEDMNFVERHGIVITRAIEPSSLAPQLTDETLRRYQATLVFSDEYVIRFIEIIKRPGQTLGLYIRSVQFEDSRTRYAREGIVITKIESDSPVYTSHVLHIGDEILSINLIDIQGMSLDDVVTLMSIPKRLVLALRVLRDRDYLAQVERGRREQVPQQQRNNFFAKQATTQDDPPPFKLAPQAPQQNLSTLSMHDTNSKTSGQEPRGTEYQMNGPGPGDFTAGNSLDFDQTMGETVFAQDQANLSTTDEYLAKIQHAIARPTRVQSAKPMRDTLDDRTPLPGDYNSNTLGTRLNRPMMECPTDSKALSSASDQLHDDSTSGSQSICDSTKKPVLNSVRLGDTPEQSSYFSSSIDAINRELKELRRQRLALSSNDPSVDEWESIMNELQS